MTDELITLDTNVLVYAAGADAGVTLLLSEDFQHGARLGGVRIVNPFKSDLSLAEL